MANILYMKAFIGDTFDDMNTTDVHNHNKHEHYHDDGDDYCCHDCS